MPEQITYMGEEAASAIIANIKENFSPISHKHSKSDIKDLIVDSELSSTSTNPIENKAVYAAINENVDSLLEDIENIEEDIKNRKFYINVTSNPNGTFSSDKTIEEINDAYADGKNLCCIFNGELIGSPIIECPGIYAFTITLALEGECGSVIILIDENGIEVMITELALKSDIPEIDTQLNINSDNPISNKAITTYLYDQLIEFFGSYPAINTTKDSHQLTDGKHMLSTWLYNPDRSDIQYSPKTYYTDVIKDDGTSYFDGYEQVTAEEKATWNEKSDFSGSFKDLTNKPTTISGYGITDSYTKSEVDSIANNKADSSHTHDASDVDYEDAKTGEPHTVQSVLTELINGKANTNHGTHVSYSTTNPVMDGTASVGTDSTVARSDHKHPTDTSRASKSEFDEHKGDTTSHITSTERTNWNAAKTHASSSHAPIDAEKNQNAFGSIVVDYSNPLNAPSENSSLGFKNGNGIQLTYTEGKDSDVDITIKNTGVLSVKTGSSNGTISVDGTDVSVKGLGTAAYESINNIQSKIDGKADDNHTHSYNIENIKSTNAPFEVIDGDNAEDLFIDVDYKLFELDRDKANANHTHTVDSSLSTTSTNPIQNKAITSWLSENVKNYQLSFNSDNGNIYLDDSNVSTIASEPEDSNSYTTVCTIANKQLSPDWNNIRNIPSASTSTKGIVKLTNSTSSTSTSTAATPNSVKSAYDLANSTNTLANNIKADLDELLVEATRFNEEGNISIADGAEVVNWIPRSTDASGNIYNGTGFKAGIRWSSSSGSETASDDYFMSGYIPAKNGDVIRIKNILFQSSSYIVLFDANKTCLGVISSLNLSDGVYFTQITSANVAFIRLSFTSITSESILTINQDFDFTGSTNIGWLVDSNGDKIAPYTLSSSVIRQNGMNIDNYISESNAAILAESKSYTDTKISESAAKTVVKIVRWS